MAKTVKKKKRLPTLRQLRQKADKLWSALVLAQATVYPMIYATCAVCNDKPAISAHHVFHKSMHGRFRYDLRNGIPICRKCHFMERRDPAPVVFAAIRHHGCTEYMEFAAEVMAARNQGAFVRKRRDFDLVIEGLEDLAAEEILGAQRQPAK